MVQLLHQVWEDPGDDSLEFCIAGRRNDELRQLLSPNARLLHSFRASSYLEAFETYYAWNGWGPYKPIPDFVDEPYTDEQLRVQREEGYEG